MNTKHPPQSFLYCTDDNPAAMPTGTAIISQHRTLAAAEAAAHREGRKFRASVYSQNGAWLPRVIVHEGQIVKRVTL